MDYATWFQTEPFNALLKTSDTTEGICGIWQASMHPGGSCNASTFYFYIKGEKETDKASRTFCTVWTARNQGYGVLEKKWKQNPISKDKLWVWLISHPQGIYVIRNVFLKAASETFNTFFFDLCCLVNINSSQTMDPFAPPSLWIKAGRGHHLGSHQGWAVYLLAFSLASNLSACTWKSARVDNEVAWPWRPSHLL